MTLPQKQNKSNMMRHCNTFKSTNYQILKCLQICWKGRGILRGKTVWERIFTLKIICKLYLKVSLFVNNLSLEIHNSFRKGPHTSKVSRRLYQQKRHWKAIQFQWAGNLAIHTSISKHWHFHTIHTTGHCTPYRHSPQKCAKWADIKYQRFFWFDCVTWTLAFFPWRMAIL